MSVKRIKSFIIVSALKSLHISANIFGLVPYKLKLNPIKASASSFAMGYSFFFTICIAFLLIICEVATFSGKYVRQINHQTVTTVNAVESIVGGFCVILIFLLQIFQRNKFIFFINEANKIYNHIYEFKNLKIRPFLDKKCSYLLMTKILSVFSQFLITITSLCLSNYRGNIFIEYFIRTLNIFFTDILTIIFSSLYFFAMIVALQFFRHLNKKLIETMKMIREISTNEKSKMKMQQYCNMSDVLDKLANLYGRISFFVENINGLFSLSILLTILNAFVLSLSGVRI